MENKKFTFRANNKLAKSIKEFSEQMNQLPSDVIRQALREFFWEIENRKHKNRIEDHEDE